MEMQNNFQKFAKIEEKAKQRTAFIVKKMKNFRARFMKQVKYEMTRKNVARLPQEELNDQFVSADEYREILQHDEIQEQLEETIRVSFLDNSQITLKKTVFDKIQQQIKEKQKEKFLNVNNQTALQKSKSTFREIRQRFHSLDKRGLQLKLKPTPSQNLNSDNQLQQNYSYLQRQESIASSTYHKSNYKNKQSASVSRRPSNDNFFSLTALQNLSNNQQVPPNFSLSKKSSFPLLTIVSDLQEYHNSKQLTRQISNASSNRINYTNQNTRIGSASSARESLSNYNHNNSNSRNKVSIPSLLLPQVKETIKQKQRIDKIIDNCRRLQEKEAFKSQAIKKSAKYLDDGMNSDFNKLQKKIQIILSLNNEFNTQQAKNLTARL